MHYYALIFIVVLDIVLNKTDLEIKINIFNYELYLYLYH